jgi:arylsulfatase A
MSVVLKHFLFGLFLTLVSAAAWAAARPNILFILADDFGWGDIRTNNPNGQVSLPTIERLANEGINFTDAHASAAKCAPSRYSLITGNYQWRGRLGWGTWQYKGGSQILSGQETLADLLRRAGYTTAFVGKYHLGADFYKKESNDFASESDVDTAVDFARAMVDGPGSKGFDYSFVAMRGIQAGPYAYFENDLLHGNPSQLITWQAGDYGDTSIIEGGIGLPTWNTRNVGPTLLSKAIDFIDSHQQAQETASDAKPFFMFFSTEAVHNPRKPPVAIGERFVLGTTGLTARTDMLVEIDAVVDTLRQKLEQLGILQDTLIIFTSDNGSLRLTAEQNAGHQSTGGFRGDKGSTYEGGHRVPLIMKWGHQAFGASPLPQGTRIGALVGLQDLYATLAELTETPLAADQARDSFSMWRILMGETTASRDHIVHEGDDNSPDEGLTGRNFAYRSGYWKLIFNNSRLPVGLFDLAVDPFETKNLIAQTSQVGRVAAMRLALDNALTSERTAPIGGTSPDSVSVPNVVGMTQLEAQTAIVNAGLVVGMQLQESSAIVPPGSVISQSPLAGTSVLTGSAVNLVVSLGSASASVTPTSLVFGNQALNVSSLGLNVTITNTGAVVLPIGSIAISGTNPAQFSRSENCPSQLQVGGTCAATVVFKPTSTGTKSAILTIAFGGGAASRTVALSGTGIVPGILFSVSPTSLSFGSVARGVTSAAQTVTITNSGTAVLPITSITLGGTNPGQFARTNNCPSQVAVGGNCTVTVVFKPTYKGAKSATLKITPGGGAAAKSVALSGTGT